VIYKVNGVPTSYSEMMGLPHSQLDKVFWLPWYNSKTMSTELGIANPSSSAATVHVRIGGAEMAGSPFTLAAGASVLKSFAGIDRGPVKIVSNVNILVSERVIYKVDGVVTSYAEMMGLPNKQLNTTFWLPWYNSKTMSSELRIANAGSASASVRVYIGGTEVTGSPFSVAPGAVARRSFLDTEDGPVKIVSNQNIVVTERVIYKANGVNTSFSEIIGLPGSLLDLTYWLPWYNNLGLNTELRLSVP
jgi:hypothetical protein